MAEGIPEREYLSIDECVNLTESASERFDWEYRSGRQGMLNTESLSVNFKRVGFILEITRSGSGPALRYSLRIYERESGLVISPPSMEDQNFTGVVKIVTAVRKIADVFERHRAQKVNDALADFRSKML